MNYKEKYHKMVEVLIKKSFPSLKNVKIKLFEFGITSLYGLYVLGNFIGINKKCRNFSNKKIEALLAHELCHAEISKKKGFFRSFFLYIYYWFSSKFRVAEEIRADKSVIKKGYARGLFELTKKIESDYKIDYPKYGLSSKKIKSLAQKSKKW